MTLADIQNPNAIRQAMAEFDHLGRDEFLAKYGFGHSRSYYIRANSDLYDSKAIVGAAHGYEFPDLGPLKAEEFSGGEGHAVKKLRDLGFEVYALDHKWRDGDLTSDFLTPGQVYTRAELAEQFGITDATINNGVFKPKGSRSVWLFVTEEKTADRPQLVDLLEGDTLLWQGQPQGRTDSWVINHQADGNELMVFYRKSRAEFPKGGFRYEGKFRYQSHEGKQPTNFVLVREQDTIAQIAAEFEATEPFDPANLEDGRKRTLAAVVRRQGQKSFRDSLLKAYGGRCCITECDVEAVLEAAHIIPYMGTETNHVQNGLLLRADIHTLFDLGLIGINPEDYSVVVSPRLRGTEYEGLAGQKVTLPAKEADRPSIEALVKRNVTQ